MMKKLLSISMCIVLLAFSVSGAVFAVDGSPLDYPDYINEAGSNNANGPLEMSVSTTLDKAIYLPGETATIGLNINNIDKGDKGSNGNRDLLFVMYDGQGNIINNYPNPITISNIDSFHIESGETKTLDPFQYMIPSDIAVDQVVLSYTVYDFGNFSGWKKTVVANGTITLPIKLGESVDISTRIYELVSDSYVDASSIVANADAGQIDFAYDDQQFTQTEGDSTTRVMALGTVVSLEAIAKTGYEFVGWYADITGGSTQSNPRTVEITASKTSLTPKAIFKKIIQNKIDFSVSDSSPDMGTISATSGEVTITSGSTHPAGTVVALVAAPVDGARVKSWTVNGVDQGSTENQLEVTLNSDLLVVVTFEEIPAPPSTEPVSEPVTEPVTQPVTQPATEPATQPATEAPIAATTEAATETIVEEEVALGNANTPFNFDSIYDQQEVTTVEATDEVTVLDEAVALGDALPQTGQLPAALYMSIGSIITALGVFLKIRK